MLTLKTLYSHPIIGLKADGLESAQVVTVLLRDKLSDGDGNLLLDDPEPIRFVLGMKEIDATLEFLHAAREELISLEEKIKTSGIDISALHWRELGEKSDA